MKFFPEKYSIPDVPMQPFINTDEIWSYINNTVSTQERVQQVVDKSLAKNRLNLEEVAVLINATDDESIQLIKNGAKELKTKVYGNRIVLFAPLYVGNKCSNNCTYCGFRASNKDAVRKTLSDNELVKEIEALEDNGQFRINDDRHLNEIIDELIEQEMLPSFCTSCYRMGRTGEHFMEFSVPGFIKRFCTPNAILTLAEYLVDYAPEHTSEKGWKVIEKNIDTLNESVQREVKEKIEKIKEGERDLYF